MTTNKPIIPGMQGLSNARIVEVQAYIDAQTPESLEERRKILRETFGSLSEEDGKAFEEALIESRRVEK